MEMGSWLRRQMERVISHDDAARTSIPKPEKDTCRKEQGKYRKRAKRMVKNLKNERTYKLVLFT